jgi:subtilase family serine protease
MKFKTFLSIGVIFLCSSVLALAALDLRFSTAISQSPDPANVGDKVDFVVSFNTFGGAVDNLKIIGGIDGATIFTRTYAHIDADKQRTDTFSWTATAGAHTAWFELDPDHTAGDSNYANNRVEKAFTVGSVQGKPNLLLNIDYNPKSFDAGDSVTFTITVTNNGDAASVPCKMTIKQGTVVMQELNVPIIAAGGTSPSQNYSWTAVCDAIIKIQVDSNSQNIESNENDNTWSRGMQCSGSSTGKPNLKLNVYDFPKEFKKGDAVTFTITVENLGDAASSPCKLSIWQGSHLKKIKDFDVPAISAGLSKLVSKYLWAVDCNEAILIKVDSLNNIDESDENDNLWAKNMKCIPGKPNLLPSVSYSPKNFKAGDNVTFKIKVKNLSDAASVPCKMTIRRGGTLVKELDVPALGAHNVSSSQTYSLAAVCYQDISIEVDSNYKNDESNEADNTWTKKMQCRGSGKPDLTPVVWYSPPPAGRREGAKITITVKNTGDVASVPCHMKVIEKRPKVGYHHTQLYSIPAIAVGGAYTQLYWTSPLPCETSITIVVDSDFKNDEFFETNNAISCKQTKCEDCIFLGVTAWVE